MGLSSDLVTEVDATLATLELLVLPDNLWQRVAKLLRQLESAVVAGDETAVQGALIPLAQIVFNAKMGRHATKSRAEAAVIIPTKSTPILPLVGIICAAILLLLAWLLGGGLILLATSALAALVMVVAISGTRSRHQKPPKSTDNATDTTLSGPAPQRVQTESDKIRNHIKE